MPSYAASHPSPLPPLPAISNFSRRKETERERERKIERFVDRSKGMVLPPEGEIKREREGGRKERRSGDKREGTGLRRWPNRG